VKFWLLTLTWNKVLRLMMLKTNLRKKKMNNNNSSSSSSSSIIKPQQKMNHRLQQVAENYQPGDHLMEGTFIFFLLLVQQKVWKKVSLHISTKTAPHCLC